MSDEVRINGVQHSWASTILKIDGKPWHGIKAIGYSHKRTRTKSYGMGRAHAPRGRTSGKYEVEPLTITMETATARLLRDEMAQKAGTSSYGDAVFQVVLQYTEGNSTITDELVDCAFESEGAKPEESPDPLYEEVTFDFMRLIRNGKTLHAPPTGGGR